MRMNRVVLKFSVGYISAKNTRPARKKGDDRMNSQAYNANHLRPH